MSRRILVYLLLLGGLSAGAARIQAQTYSSSLPVVSTPTPIPVVVTPIPTPIPIPTPTPTPIPTPTPVATAEALPVTGSNDWAYFFLIGGIGACAIAFYKVKWEK